MSTYTRCIILSRIFNTNLLNTQVLSDCYVKRIICKRYKHSTQSIQYMQVNGFHTNICLFKRRKTAEERKSVRIIEYSPKSKIPLVEVWRDVTMVELADILNRDVDYIRDLFLNQIKNPNTPINDIKVLNEAIKRSGHRMQLIGKSKNINDKVEEKDVFRRPPAAKSDLKPRPPVVTVMGHVDHGKTTLLDALRHSSVVDQEFGGITQHIGAFSVVLDSGARITFLDTPGHAAFSAMRARGANLTDIVVLVVAADDGVMEQTIESIRMARQAKVPIMVAINKIDSPKADVERTENMLVEVGLQVERLGGDVQAIPVSALKRQNLDELVEALVLQAELLEIGADPTGPVEAVVVESKVEEHRGKLCTVVVQRGTLNRGDILVAGTSMAKVRSLKNAEGKTMNNVSPGYPAEVEGWRDLPPAGEQVLQVATEKIARSVIKFRKDVKDTEKLDEDAVAITQKQEQHEREYREKLQRKRMMGHFKFRNKGPRKPEINRDDSGPPTLNVIVKTDVDGTLEAILNTLDSYESEECKLDLVHYGVGTVTQNDVELAEPFNAIIYAFNVECPKNVSALAETANVELRHHNVIYKLVDDVKKEINARLPQKEIEDILGEATVLQQFEITQGKKKIPVAGCRCVKGSLKRSGMYRLIRNGQIIYSGPLSSMRHLKSEADVIKTDTECGLQLFDKTVTFQQGDVLVCFEKKMQAQETEWDPGF